MDKVVDKWAIFHIFSGGKRKFGAFNAPLEQNAVPWIAAFFYKNFSI